MFTFAQVRLVDGHATSVLHIIPARHHGDDAAFVTMVAYAIQTVNPSARKRDDLSALLLFKLYFHPDRVDIVQRDAVQDIRSYSMSGSGISGLIAGISKSDAFPVP